MKIELERKLFSTPGDLIEDPVTEDLWEEGRLGRLRPDRIVFSADPGPFVDPNTTKDLIEAGRHGLQFLGSLGRVGLDIAKETVNFGVDHADDAARIGVEAVGKGVYVTRTYGPDAARVGVGGAKAVAGGTAEGLRNIDQGIATGDEVQLGRGILQTTLFGGGALYIYNRLRGR